MSRFPAPIDHIYILCNPQHEPDRAKYLNDWLTANNMDRSQITFHMPTYKNDPQFQMRDVWQLYSPWQRPSPCDRFSRNLKPGEISLVLNFASAARLAVAAGYQTVLFLESDVIFGDKFLEKLKACLESAPPTWDFLSISAGNVGLRPTRPPEYQNSENMLWLPTINPYFHTRCTDSMIFRVSLLEKILGTLFPFAETLDWELNYQLTRHSSRSFWLDPPLIRPGSWKEYPGTL